MVKVVFWYILDSRGFELIVSMLFAIAGSSCQSLTAVRSAEINECLLMASVELEHVCGRLWGSNV